MVFTLTFIFYITLSEYTGNHKLDASPNTLTNLHNSEKQMSLKCMLLDCWRKPEYLEKPAQQIHKKYFINFPNIHVQNIGYLFPVICALSLLCSDSGAGSCWSTFPPSIKSVSVWIRLLSAVILFVCSSVSLPLHFLFDCPPGLLCFSPYFLEQEQNWVEWRQLSEDTKENGLTESVQAHARQ